MHSPSAAVGGQDAWTYVSGHLSSAEYAWPPGHRSVLQRCRGAIPSPVPAVQGALCQPISCLSGKGCKAVI